MKSQTDEFQKSSLTNLSKFVSFVILYKVSKLNSDVVARKLYHNPLGSYLLKQKKHLTSNEGGILV